MSTPTLTPAAGPIRGATGKPPESPTFPRRKLALVLVAICVILSIAAVFCSRVWPFTERAVAKDLAEASDSAVTVRSARCAYFPAPGCVLEGVEFRHGTDSWTLITIDKLTIEGSYLGILARHVPRVLVEGGHLYVPPFGSGVTFKTQHSSIVIEQVMADGAVVEFASDDSKKAPLRFEVRSAVLRDVRWGSPIVYELKLHNPEPPGEIATRGKFGGWTTGRPGETPISGEYTFERADLSVYGGIAGMLASKGKYAGVLQHIDIAGSADVPDFEVTSGGHKVDLVTQFDAFVDAIHGDTFLKRVEAHIGHTKVTAQGSIAGAKDREGKIALLSLIVQGGRIEDMLGLFVESRRSPMSGVLTLRTKVEIPSGSDSFLKKVKLQGSFGVDEGNFSESETQNNVDELSAGARGEKMQDAATVLTDLKGAVTLEGGIARFSDLSFGVPGAAARMYGNYSLLTYQIDLHGRMSVDTKISKTTTGVKSLLLKAIDPFFKKKKTGEIVPVHISGTYDHPQFGLDLTKPTSSSNSEKSGASER
jgi:AsmA-like C-terminal region